MAETTTQTVLEVDSHLRERTNRQQNARQQEANNWVTREHHGRGETAQQHAAHASTKHKQHFGLSLQNDEILFWCIAIPSWVLQIAAAITGSLLRTSSHAFIATMTPHFILHWAAWLQTAIGMTRRASWVRDEGDLVERTEFLVLAVRLNRLMMVRPPFLVLSLGYSRLTITTANSSHLARRFHSSLCTKA